MDHCRAWLRDRQPQGGSGSHECMAAGRGVPPVVRADVLRFRQSRAAVCQRLDSRRAAAVGRDRLLLRRLVPVQELHGHRLALRNALHGYGTYVHRLLRMDYSRAGTGLATAAGNGCNADRHIGRGARSWQRPPSALATAYERHTLRHRRKRGTGFGTGAEQDRTRRLRARRAAGIAVRSGRHAALCSQHDKVSGRLRVLHAADDDTAADRHSAHQQPRPKVHDDNAHRRADRSVHRRGLLADGNTVHCCRHSKHHTSHYTYINNSAYILSL